ncbi:protein DELETION OF SUV3 SUPPRESSOR 1(I)-like [Salvia hispanica]|uniref:protein DELETION OF SUV3 SUPPRESSOR 1(I)-like n=1 Tax=Salvia hispanica TaxID=49212 RepID=UPI0020095BC8|nr:protein DELETION OF SUV3 SUPPRESSOR 1(I)-like [Salvia hispanica]XP_047956921.1 protein DELETION OF SUV3 SUPPRESSOR 1(I)-like [Salvia hispanica]XP_047956922.1 protein DELETION OF SUV3 SUPPRESSOR 1(I)-like [Salvia hispanica]XP_047956923.1 protein DELETION OF SUV3 SUPPRESSOR 1(I)-like [Salvia hispanica]
MATEGQKPSAEEVKTDLFEDDDEFEEFEIDRVCEDLADWDEQNEGEVINQQWEDDWDDDDVNDDFSMKLRKELESEAKST